MLGGAENWCLPNTGALMVTVISALCSHWFIFLHALVHMSSVSGHQAMSCWMMTRRIGAYRCVRTSSSLLKLNQICEGMSSPDMSHGSSSTTKRQNARAFSGRVRCHQDRRKQDSRNPKWKSCWWHFFFRCEGHRPQWSCHKARRLTSTSTNYPVAFASFSAWEEVRVVAASTWQRACSQCPDHPSVPGWEEYHHAGATSLLTWPGSVWVFSLPQAQGGYRGDKFWRHY